MILAEAALVLVVIVVFLAISPAVWQIWETEHFVTAEAHRDVFHKLTVPMDVAVPGTRWGAPNRVRLNLQSGPALPELRALSNKYVEGWDGRELAYGSGGVLQGDMRISRYALSIRSPWFWSEWPFVSTAVPAESQLVSNWYRKLEAETLKPHVRTGLNLEESALTHLGSIISDKAKKKLIDRLTKKPGDDDSGSKPKGKPVATFITPN